MLVVWVSDIDLASLATSQALLHNGCDHDCPWSGRHAWSRDGLHWTLSHKIAYSNTITYTDGAVETHKRRERPHVILSNVTGQPIGLVTASKAEMIPARGLGFSKWLKL